MSNTIFVAGSTNTAPALTWLSVGTNILVANGKRECEMSYPEILADTGLNLFFFTFGLISGIFVFWFEIRRR